MNTISKLLEELEEKSKRFDLEHERTMIQMRIMSQVEAEMEKQNLSYKALAEKIGVSPQFLTQLFKGHKKLNLETIAKFQLAFGKKFHIELMDYEKMVKQDQKTKFVEWKVYKNSSQESKTEQIAV